MSGGGDLTSIHSSMAIGMGFWWYCNFSAENCSLFQWPKFAKFYLAIHENCGLKETEIVGSEPSATHQGEGPCPAASRHK
jgi:hypothetical protein